MLWAALVLSALLSTYNALMTYIDEMAVHLRISMKTPESQSGVLFYDIGKGYHQDHLSSAYIPGDGRFHEISFRLPILKNIYHLRFDPPSVKTGEIAINRMELIDHYGRLLQRFDLGRLQPITQIKQFTFQDGEVRFGIDEPATDPQLDLGLDRPIPIDRFQFIRMLLSGILIDWIGIFVICVLLIFVWSAFSDKTAATLIVLALFAAGWFFHQEIVETRKGAVSSFFKVSMMSDVRGTAKLYYDRGQGLNEADVIELDVYKESDIAADDFFRDYTFKIPGRFFQLRFDPLVNEGTVTIRKIEVADQSGKVLEIPFDDLKPKNDIKTFEKRGKELVVVMNKNATDPQIEILHAERFSPEPTKTFPLRAFLIRIFIGWSVIGFCLFAGIVIWKKFGQNIIRFIDGSCFQRQMHLFYLGSVLALVLAMAMVSTPHGNPDELGHVKCADYYVNAWLPPAVDSPAALKTISGYGVSYLFGMEIVYLLAGKAAVLFSYVIRDFYLMLRMFNFLLFTFLIMMAIRRTQNPLLFVLGLVATPQVWYIFSYFNGDAFPLFVALFIAAQVMYSDSLSGQYLSSPTLWRHMSGGVLLGILVGIMLLSKMNYYVYLAFIALVVLFRLFVESGLRTTDRWFLQSKKVLFIAVIALSVYLPYFTYDQYINDFQKDKKIGEVVEKHALPMFKASTVKNNPSESYRGLALRDKGIKFRELFLEWDEWQLMSFKSLFGVYGYMNLYSKSYHFKTLFVLLAGGFLFIVFYLAYHSLPFKDTLVLFMVLLFSSLAIGQSMYFSWTADYEPQGRYLFPLIPMVLVGLTRLPDILQRRFVPCFNVCLFLLSLYSFTFTALLYIPKVD